MSRVLLIKRLVVALTLVLGVSQSTVFADWQMPWDKPSEKDEYGHGSSQHPKIWDADDKYDRNDHRNDENKNNDDRDENKRDGDSDDNVSVSKPQE